MCGALLTACCIEEDMIPEGDGNTESSARQRAGIIEEDMIPEGDGNRDATSRSAAASLN